MNDVCLEGAARVASDRLPSAALAVRHESLGHPFRQSDSAAVDPVHLAGHDTVAAYPEPHLVVPQVPSPPGQGGWRVDEGVTPVVGTEKVWGDRAAGMRREVAEQ